MGRDYMPKSKKTIYQEKGLFAFSMDSVLLAAYGKAKGNVLDLGCGSGFLAMAAYDEAESVTAVDIEPRAVELLEKSAAENGMSMEIRCGDFRTLDLGTYHTIWTNPPFYKSSLQNKNSRVARAKHLAEEMRWFYEASKLLKPKGALYAVVDVAHFQDILVDLEEGNMTLSHLRPVYWREGEQARRILFTAIKGGGSFLHMAPPLYIYEVEDYTEEVAGYYGR